MRVTDGLYINEHDSPSFHLMFVSVYCGSFKEEEVILLIFVSGMICVYPFVYY